MTPTKVVRFLVLFLIDLKSRGLEIAGTTRDPNGASMNQVARNFSDAYAGFLRGTRYLIYDHDPLFTAGFQAILKSSGVEAVKLPARSPNVNAYAERFVRSVKSECLAKVIPLGERHLRLVLAQFTGHYHRERNHQGLENRLIEGARSPPGRHGPVQRRESLAGVLSYYYRDAA